MSIHPAFRVRFLFLLVGGLALGLVFAIPFAAQKKPPANPPASPMVNPDLPAGAFDERLIPLPATASSFCICSIAPVSDRVPATSNECGELA